MQEQFSLGSLHMPPSPTPSRRRSPAARSGPDSTSRRPSPPDGTIYIVSRAHLNDFWGYPRRRQSRPDAEVERSLRNRFHDGCNILLPPNGTTAAVRRERTPASIRRTTTTAPAGVIDSRPLRRWSLPDGSIIYGAYRSTTSTRVT